MRGLLGATGLACMFVTGSAAVVAAQTVPYRVTITGVEDAALLAWLTSVSSLVTRQDKPPPSLSALRSRADDDVRRLTTALDSWGYFDAAVARRVDRNTKPATVTITVTPGPEFTLSSYELHPVHGVAHLPEALHDLSALGIALGQPYRAETIIEAGKRIATRLQQNGYPFGKIVEQKVVADHADHTVQADLAVDPGPLARFGAITVHGLHDVDEVFVRRRSTIKPGEIWDSAKIEQTRNALLGTGLFSSVHFDHPATVDAAGAVPLSLTLAEGKPRNVGAGLRYSTSEGTGARATWEHRDLFGRGENLQLQADIATITQSLGANYRQPDFLRPNQALLLGGSFGSDDTDAYRTRRAGVNAAIERHLTPHLRGTLGLSFDHTVTDQSGQTRTFNLVGVPLTLGYDDSNSLLDPTRGMRVDVTATPYSSLFGSSLSFTRLQISPAGYIRLDKSAHTILALRGSVGSILGTGRDDTPPEHRFYAGGSSTVRGFPYQKAGPVDVNGNPVGGLSIISGSVELRYRLTESFGIVPFVDAATVSDSRLPKLDKSVFVGAGLGVRYYTAFGPIRVDIGVPVNHRDTVGAPFQIYASIGQAF